MDKKSILMIDTLGKLEETNALLGFMQTAFAEGEVLQSNKETADALYHIYKIQSKTLEEMKKMIKGE